MIFILILILNLLSPRVSALLLAKPDSGDLEASLLLSVVIFVGFGALAIRSKPEMIIAGFIFSFFIGASALEPGVFMDVNIEECNENKVLDDEMFKQLAVQRLNSLIEQWSQNCTKSQNAAETDEQKKYLVVGCDKIKIFKQSKWCAEYYYVCSSPTDVLAIKNGNIDSWIKGIFSSDNIARQKVYLLKIASVVEEQFGAKTVADVAKVKCILDYVTSKHYQIGKMVEDLVVYKKIQTTTISEWMLIRTGTNDWLNKIVKSSFKEPLSIKRVLIVISFAILVYVLIMSLANRVIRSYTGLITVAIISISVVMMIF